MSSSTAQDHHFGSCFLDDILIWVGKEMDPEDVFTDRRLRAWALENGFVEGE